MHETVVLKESNAALIEKFEVLNGMRCKFRSKAAFMAMLARYELEGENLLVKVILDHEALKRKFTDTGVAGLKTLALDTDDLEEFFDILTVKSKGSFDNLNLETRLYAKPLELNNETLEIDSMGYLVYGIIKKSGCLRELKMLTAGREAELYFAFRESPYYETEILSMFMQREKRMAALLIGLICIARRNRQGLDDAGKPPVQRNDASDAYGDLMKIVSAGYKMYRNRIKRLDFFDIYDFREIMIENSSFFTGYSEAAVCLLIAESLEIPVIHNYTFYNFIYCLWERRTYFVREKTTEIVPSEQGKKWRNKYFGMRGLSSFYDIYYNRAEAAEGDEQEKQGKEKNMFDDFFDENARTLEETVFEQFHLNLRALDGYVLDESEVDGLCERLARGKEKEYCRYLLIATMCKYIHELEMLCMEQADEEKEYRELVWEREAIRKLDSDFEKEREKLLSAKKQEHEKLVDAEREKDKLKERLKKIEEKEEAEKQELAALRNYVYQHEQGGFEDENTDKREEEARLKYCRVAIVGGHPNWQKKMKEYFKDAVLIGAENNHFNPAVLHGLDYIIMNTGIMKHACYYRVLAQKDLKTKILYAGSNNRELCLRQLCRQLN